MIQKKLNIRGNVFPDCKQGAFQGNVPADLQFDISLTENAL